MWTEDSEGYSDFQIVTEVWVEPQCGYVQMPIQSTAIYMHPLQYHQLHDAVSTIFILLYITTTNKNFVFKFKFCFMLYVMLIYSHTHICIKM